MPQILCEDDVAILVQLNRNKIVRDQQLFLSFLDQVPQWAPWGLDSTKIAHAQLDHGANNMRP